MSPDKSLAEILAHRMHAGQPMPVPLTLAILRQLCDVLDYAHNLRDPSGRPLGIVHGDVSPPHIVITAAGQVRLDQRRTNNGTFAYMAPEYATQLILDPRADLFALGVVAHEMLTNQPLFAARGDKETLDRVCTWPVPAPSTINPYVPPELDNIVLSALARDPMQRWQNAAMIRDALVWVARQYGLEVPPQHPAWDELLATQPAQQTFGRSPQQPHYEQGVQAHYEQAAAPVGQPAQQPSSQPSRQPQPTPQQPVYEQAPQPQPQAHVYGQAAAPHGVGLQPQPAHESSPQTLPLPALKPYPTAQPQRPAQPAQPAPQAQRPAPSPQRSPLQAAPQRPQQLPSPPSSLGQQPTQLQAQPPQPQQLPSPPLSSSLLSQQAPAQSPQPHASPLHELAQNQAHQTFGRPPSAADLWAEDDSLKTQMREVDQGVVDLPDPDPVARPPRQGALPSILPPKAANASSPIGLPVVPPVPGLPRPGQLKRPSVIPVSAQSDQTRSDVPAVGRNAMDRTIADPAQFADSPMDRTMADVNGGSTPQAADSGSLQSAADPADSDQQADRPDADRSGPRTADASGWSDRSADTDRSGPAPAARDADRSGPAWRAADPADPGSGPMGRPDLGPGPADRSGPNRAGKGVADLPAPRLGGKLERVELSSPARLGAAPPQTGVADLPAPPRRAANPTGSVDPQAVRFANEDLPAPVSRRSGPTVEVAPPRRANPTDLSGVDLSAADLPSPVSRPRRANPTGQVHPQRADPGDLPAPVPRRNVPTGEQRRANQASEEVDLIAAAARFGGGPIDEAMADLPAPVSRRNAASEVAAPRRAKQPSDQVDLIAAAARFGGGPIDEAMADLPAPVARIVGESSRTKQAGHAMEDLPAPSSRFDQLDLPAPVVRYAGAPMEDLPAAARFSGGDQLDLPAPARRNFEPVQASSEQVDLQSAAARFGGGPVDLAIAGLPSSSYEAEDAPEPSARPRRMQSAFDVELGPEPTQVGAMPLISLGTDAPLVALIGETSRRAPVTLPPPAMVTFLPNVEDVAPPKNKRLIMIIAAAAVVVIAFILVLVVA